MGLDLKGSVSLDGSGWEAGIKKMEKGADAFAHSLKHMALEAAGVYGVAEAVKKTVEYATELVETANRLGVGTEALQEFGFAARMSGSSVEALRGFVERLNTARIDPKKFGAFAKLGVDESDLKTAPVEELLMKISASVRNRSSQEVIAPLRQVGGKAAGELLPMLQENMEEVRKEAHELGQVMSKEDLVALKFISDEMKVLAQLVLVKVAPAILLLGESFLRLLGFAQAFIKFAATSTRSVSLKDVFDAAAGPYGIYVIARKMIDSFKDAVVDAGVSGVQSDYDIDQLKKRLLDMQNQREKINATPDFAAPEEKKAKEQKSLNSNLQVGDSLTRVGNFLGAGRYGLTSLAEQQVSLLRQIAENTKPNFGSSGNETWDTTGIPQQ